MNIKPSPHDPCLFSGIIDNTDPKSTRHTIHVSAYVDNFVLYSTDPAEEEKIKTTLESKLKVDFIGDADYFLGTALIWLHHDDDHVSIHLSQSVFTEFAANRFSVRKNEQSSQHDPLPLWIAKRLPSTATRR